MGWVEAIHEVVPTEMAIDPGLQHERPSTKARTTASSGTIAAGV